MLHQESFTVQTKGRGTYETTDEVQQIVSDAGISDSFYNAIQNRFFGNRHQLLGAGVS